MSTSRSNLISPNQIRNKCDLHNLENWFKNETEVLVDSNLREIILGVCNNIDSFVKWPINANLLWEGCDRSVKYHKYPHELKQLAKIKNIPLDGRTNGPAVVAYLAANGLRPQRYGSNNRWSIHHIYSGKFPYIGKVETLHAAKNGRHFTQSAGLVAIHPIADQVCDEYPFFSWYLRAKSFIKFGYDPDSVFSIDPHDIYGFVLPN